MKISNMVTGVGFAGLAAIVMTSFSLFGGGKNPPYTSSPKNPDELVSRLLQYDHAKKNLLERLMKRKWESPRLDSYWSIIARFERHEDVIEHLIGVLSEIRELFQMQTPIVTRSEVETAAEETKKEILGPHLDIMEEWGETGNITTVLNLHLEEISRASGKKELTPREKGRLAGSRLKLKHPHLDRTQARKICLRATSGYGKMVRNPSTGKLKKVSYIGQELNEFVRGCQETIR